MIEDTQSQEQIFSSQGIPFKSEAAAKKVITDRGLDANQFEPRSFEDGYVIVRKQIQKDPEKYYRVIFSPKSNPYDQDDVILTVNGETLVIQRSIEVIIPARFKECADHATRVHWVQQNPNEPRKKRGDIMTFPYSLAGEASEEEFRKQLADGNKQTKQALAQTQKLIS